MGNHFEFFYFFVTFAVGVASTGVALMVYLRQRQAIFRDYLFFHFAFTYMVTSRLFLAYIRANLPEISEHWLLAFEYQEAFIAKYLLMFAIPYFTHRLFQVERRRRRNLYFGMLTLATFIGQHFTEYHPNKSVDQMGDLFERVVLVLVVLYSLIISTRRYAILENSSLALSGRAFALVTVLFLPALLLDLFLEDLPIRLYPILYLYLTFTFTRHLVLTGFKPTSSQPKLSPREALQGLGLSSREMDVAMLLLEGQRNREIGQNLNISLSTVKTHVRHIFQKCDVSSRYEFLTTFGK